MTKPKRHGGPGRGQGRKPLDKENPGIRIYVTVPAAMLQHIDAQPGATRSEKLRGIVEAHQQANRA